MYFLPLKKQRKKSFKPLRAKRDETRRTKSEFSSDQQFREEKRRYDQARFARRLKMEDKRRLLGVQSSEEDSSEENSRTPTKLENIIESGSSFMRWQEKEKIIIRLTGVTVLSKVGGQGGEPIVGTLEAHVHGFVYTAPI
ncbi:hypothetical protein C5167_022493 [Papaver somniferum]|uniref:Uncharacterized protein n=1 Tax=Papaver somniferum TaxID=3469 RepID=A0A4Y7JL20_PAPSO|nr:hypothetical protein C5167_022493 [Papaver somniferum]